MGGIAWDTLMVWWLGPRRAKALILAALAGPEGAQVRGLIVAPALDAVTTEVRALRLELEKRAGKPVDPEEIALQVRRAVSDAVESRLEGTVKAALKGAASKVADEVRESLLADDKLLGSALDADLREGGMSSKANEWAAKLSAQGYGYTAAVVRRTPRVGLLLLKRMGMDEKEVREWQDALA